jgi:hypothetical protein
MVETTRKDLSNLRLRKHDRSGPGLTVTQATVAGQTETQLAAESRRRSRRHPWIWTEPTLSEQRGNRRLDDDAIGALHPWMAVGTDRHRWRVDPSPKSIMGRCRSDLAAAWVRSAGA